MLCLVKTDPASSSSHMGVYKLRAKARHKNHTSARGVNGNRYGSISYAIREEPMVSVPLTTFVTIPGMDRNTDSKRHIQPQEGGKNV